MQSESDIIQENLELGQEVPKTVTQISLVVIIIIIISKLLQNNQSKNVYKISPSWRCEMLELPLKGIKLIFHFSYINIK